MGRRRNWEGEKQGSGGAGRRGSGKEEERGEEEKQGGRETGRRKSGEEEKRGGEERGRGRAGKRWTVTDTRHKFDGWY